MKCRDSGLPWKIQLLPVEMDHQACVRGRCVIQVGTDFWETQKHPRFQSCPRELWTQGTGCWGQFRTHSLLPCLLHPELTDRSDSVCLFVLHLDRLLLLTRLSLGRRLGHLGRGRPSFAEPTGSQQDSAAPSAQPRSRLCSVCWLFVFRAF